MVVPFNISCGHCFMCGTGLQSQCETTQVREYGTGAALLGYTKLYGQVPGGQAELLRVPQAHYGPIKVPEGPPDDRFVYLSDVLPTAWQAVEYADVPDGGSVLVLGLGPIGEMCVPRSPSTAAPSRSSASTSCPSGSPARARTASRRSTSTARATTSPSAVRELTDGRGPDAVIDAVGMEAHGAPIGQARAADRRRCCPTRSPRKVMEKAGVDRLSALHAAIDLVRRGGTISMSASTAARSTRCR